ncbi:FAD-binding oxidoreductase [Ramlibacter algicola]|uniref:FAD-binding oxidoreductase n=1 Tax=Ramlibacter algicola TaxID=2795217 RepID=A0A934Q1C3_9BURK|nr:FAD-binding oxidoreductase [Ramlibacter algicola]MBK0392691.1 FAD-binding oxidoreductase [Ramlibacter algicola]
MPAPIDSGRRRLLKAAATIPVLPAAAAAPIPQMADRVRPGHPHWPAPAVWQQLGAQLEGGLRQVRSPWPACRADAAACADLFQRAKNPYFLGDDVALTQTLGWVDAWTSSPSAYAVEARKTSDVVAAVNFAREHRLRLVVKGGGHSYQGTSNAPDSLLVWTRRMDAVQLHEAFVPANCAAAPQRAVSVGAGALWAHVYDAVTTRGGGYVQGGGCMTVGVAGLVQSGGFGSFSKRFGLAAGNLLEAEVVTADGTVRIANACTHPDLFWAIKGGGGGTFGIVTRLVLRVHELPETFGAVNFTVRAASPDAFRKLIRLAVDHYAERLMNPHWGEQIRIRRDNALAVSMVFQGLGRSEANAIWQPFFDAVGAAPKDFSIDFSPLKVVSTSARTFWSPTLLKRTLGFIRRDDRPGAPEANVFWPGDQGQAGQVLHAYQSTWLPAVLLQQGRRSALCDALFAASRHWGVSLHFNKGLAGAPPDAIDAARDTAMNPVAAEAFALAISGAEEQPSYPGVAGHEPHVAEARERREAIGRARDELRRVAGKAGSYVSESDFFEAGWQQAFWGDHYPRLLGVKAKYDPSGLFFVRHGVGSVSWTDDGFSRRPSAGH